MRLAPVRSFNARLAAVTGLDDVKALVTEAVVQAQMARRHRDAAGYKLAVAQGDQHAIVDPDWIVELARPAFSRSNLTLIKKCRTWQLALL